MARLLERLATVPPNCESPRFRDCETSAPFPIRQVPYERFDATTSLLGRAPEPTALEPHPLAEPPTSGVRWRPFVTNALTQNSVFLWEGAKSVKRSEKKIGAREFELPTSWSRTKPYHNIYVETQCYYYTAANDGTPAPGRIVILRRPSPSSSARPTTFVSPHSGAFVPQRSAAFGSSSWCSEPSCARIRRRWFPQGRRWLG